MLYRAFPDDPEGQLSLRLTALVRNETLAEIARDLGIDRCILMAPGEERNGTRNNTTVLAGVTEALIAALFLDGGLERASAFIAETWRGRMTAKSRPDRDSKTRLQEWALARGLVRPSYTMVDKEGPEHRPVITIDVHVDGLGRASARGGSRRAAELAAAQALLDEAAARDAAP